MSSLTFFFIFIAGLAFLLLAINLLARNCQKDKSSIVQLESSSDLLIVLLILYFGAYYLYNSIPEAIYKDIVFTSTYVIKRITI